MEVLAAVGGHGEKGVAEGVGGGQDAGVLGGGQGIE